MVKQYIPLNFRLYLFFYRNKCMLICLLIILLLIIKFDLAFLILAAEPEQDFDNFSNYEEEDEPYVDSESRSDISSLKFDSTSSSDTDFDSVITDKYQHRLRLSRIRDLIEASSDDYDTLRFVKDLTRIAKSAYSSESNILDPFSGNNLENSSYTPTASFLHKCCFFLACVLLSFIFGGLVQGYLLPLGYSMNLIAYKIAVNEALSEIEYNKEAIFALFNMLNDCGLVFYDGEDIPSP